MKKSDFSRDLRRSQVDRLIAELRSLPLNRPQSGWIRTVREMLGMTQKQLAERMSVSPPSLARLEKAEVSNATTLKLLDRAAAALQCRLVYVLIPETGSFEDMVRQRAHDVAMRAVEMASTSMQLEGQGVDADMQRQQVQRLAQELIRTADKRMWETSE